MGWNDLETLCADSNGSAMSFSFCHLLCNYLEDSRRSINLLTEILIKGENSREGRAMQNIELLKKNVSGVDGSFLIKDGEIVECDFEEEKVHFLPSSLSYLAETSTKYDRELKKLSVVADSHCMIFFYDKYILGIVASDETNFPLLDMVSHKLLYTIDVSPEKAEEVIDEVLQRMDTFIK